MKHKLHTVATVGTSAENRNLSSQTVHRDRGNTAFFSGHPCLGGLFGHTATSESPMLCQSLQQAPSSLSWVGVELFLWPAMRALSGMDRR